MAENLVWGDNSGYQDVFLRDVTSGVTMRVSEGESEEANGNSASPRISSDGDSLIYFSSATNIITDSPSSVSEVYLFRLSTGQTELVSGQCVECTTELSSNIELSGDGLKIAYSTRRILLSSDTETEHDIYVYDVASEVTTHESLNSADENGSFFWGSNCFTPTLTTDGRFLGFLSAARNLDTPDITIENFHAYVKDVDTRALTRVSRHNGGTANCDGEQHASGSGSPRMDSTGNIAVFQSSCAFDLPATEPADVGGFRDVFLRDIAAETTRRLSLASTGDEADGDSDLVAMSDDAHYVLFSSQATNLVPDDTNGALDLFVHDTTTSTTTRVSLSQSYEQISEGVVTAAMSRNGDYVLFTTQANLLPSDTNVETDDLYMVRLR